MATVLIVDDEDAVREGLALALTDAGHQVLQAANGEQALALLHPTADPMIILLDRMMPILSGDYVIMAMAASPSVRQRHALIVITAASETVSPLVRHAMQQLNAMLIAKPFDIGVVLAQVNQMATHLDTLSKDDQRASS